MEIMWPCKGVQLSNGLEFSGHNALKRFFKDQCEDGGNDAIWKEGFPQVIMKPNSLRKGERRCY